MSREEGTDPRTEWGRETLTHCTQSTHRSVYPKAARMSGSILKDHQFHEYCKVLKISANELVPSDPDKKVIEKAFRKCALKTHPDKVVMFT